ncbi:MAG TPA: DOMON-like domain-containing protein [Rhizomicrobium sp.]|nr:DOMON-like domain-containing protein [Rhizomicrobium sp.]
MRRSLLLHPDSRCEAIESIEAEVTRSSPGSLVVRYFVTGEIRSVRLPLPSGAARVDGLWRHTCFELFLRVGGEDAYCEFNFAPSLQWAAHAFDGYRSRMRTLEIRAPRIEMRQDARVFELQAEVNLAGMPDADSRADWRLGLSAVIEEKNCNISYFALAHVPGKPDFHHADGFALSIQAP